MKKNKIQFTIIIPTYKEKYRLPGFLKSLKEKFDRNSEVEIILVDDGSPPDDFKDMKFQIESEGLDKGWNFKILRYEKNAGKGRAISFGLEYASSNDYLGFIDADGATPAYEIKRAWDFLIDHPNVDYLAGARIVMFGRKVEKSFKRHLASRIFSTYFTMIYGIKMYDPQCGMKIFKRAAYEEVKDRIVDYRWLWDTQLTILMYKTKKYKMEEIPIDWKDIPGSKINLWKDSIKMFYYMWKSKSKSI